MLEALTAASDVLCAALEGYTSICLDIQRSYARGEKLHMINPQLPQRIEAEAKLAASLEVKLRKAIAAISWSRNQSNTRVTINSLPSELLVRIFHIVHGMQPCAKGGHDYYKRREVGPASPTALSLVCSRWREITFSTPTLWPHIDLSTSTLLNRTRLNGLMGVHIDQAGPLPLYLHVFDSHAYRSTWNICDILKVSIAQLASRVISFELDVYNFSEHENACYEILSTFFNNCTPEKLTQLTLVMPHSIYHVPLLFRDHDPSAMNSLNVSTEQLENILSYVTVLRLSQFCLPWNSCAYHGLVELRLTGLRIDITESELVDMVQHSPDLRILHLDVEMLDPLPANSQITPIPLNNLEVLNLVGSISMQAGTFLRWLAPGSKQLLLAVKDSSFQDLQLKEENSRLFFSRSYITRAYGAWLTPTQIIDFLDLTPNLGEIALQISEHHEPSQWEVDEIASERQLECLHIVFSHVFIDTIKALMDTPSLTIKKVSLYRCELHVGDCRIPEDQLSSYTEQLAQIYPGVKFIIGDPQGPNPLKSWNLFEWYESNNDLTGIP